MIGFIGIGNMGNAMAASLMKQGYELIIHDINKKSAEKLMQNGAQWAESPKEVALRSSIICTMLPSEIEAEKVVYGDNGVLSGLNPNTIYIDHTTNSPEFIKKTGEFINKKKIFHDRCSSNGRSSKHKQRDFNFLCRRRFFNF